MAKKALEWPIDVLYFADSMGSMNVEQTQKIISWLRKYWDREIGIHAHDNMGMALQNTMAAIDSDVTWVDSTITGMGRGPGNTKTEYLALELSRLRSEDINLVPIMNVIQEFFKPMMEKYGWGTNTYYYLAGRYSIHPSYVQEMLGDSRYSEEDILAVIDHLRVEGGKKFSLNNLDSARHFYTGEPRGNWSPKNLIEDKDVLLLGAGPGVEKYKSAIENYIRKNKPVVLALNTQDNISAELIDARIACHPVRLLADCEAHLSLQQPLITPASMLPDDVLESLKGKEVYDFGLEVKEGQFIFEDTYCALPSSLVISYALAIASSGKANKILFAGFDGYNSDDPRSIEMQNILSIFKNTNDVPEIISVTPTQYQLNKKSIFAL